MKITIIGRYVGYAISYSRITHDIATMLSLKGHKVDAVGFVTYPTPIRKYTPYNVYHLPEYVKIPNRGKDNLIEMINNSPLQEPDLVLIIEDVTYGDLVNRLKSYWPHSKYIMFTMFDALHLTDSMFFAGGPKKIFDVFDSYDKIIVPTKLSDSIFAKNNIYTEICPLWFNENIFQYSNIIKTNKPTFLTVARNTERKNLGNLLFAIRDLQTAKSNVTFRFRTEFRLYDGTSIDLPGLVSNLGLSSDYISFDRFNPVEGYEESSLIYSYNYSDYGIYPSIREGWALPPLEALACGKPVFVPDNGVMNEWVPDYLPRIKSNGCNISGGFTSEEPIINNISIFEIIDKTLKGEYKFPSPEKIRESVMEFSMSNIMPKLYKSIIS